MPLFNISDLIWDEIIYPRSARKQQTIDAYSEALAAGAQFPPIIIQPVVNYPAPNTSLFEILLLILDGIHRWSAYKVLGLTEIEAVLWQEQPLDYATCKDDMLLESARRNINHGDRLSQTDKRQVARDIVSRDPNYQLSEELLAGSLGVTRQTVNNWIKDIRARQKASRDSTIHRLNRLGWTQQKIAQVMDISQARVSGIINNANFCIIDNLIALGREMPYIAGHLNMDLATVWAIKLTGLKDQEKFKALGWGLRTWDQWYFNDCDDRFGTDWPGRIPAQLVAHTLFYLTDPSPHYPGSNTCSFLPGFLNWPMKTPVPAPSWPFSTRTGAILNPPRQKKNLRITPSPCLIFTGSCQKRDGKSPTALNALFRQSASAVPW